MLRSGSHWSVGVHKVENSIYKAMVQAIQNAEYYIYIENQFFITSSTPKTLENYEWEEVKNKIGKALVDKVKEAHE